MSRSRPELVLDGAHRDWGLDLRMVRRGYIDTSLGQVHYRVVRPSDPVPGRRPLVCLHLSPGSGRMYERFLTVMGNDRVAVAADTPGFGASDPPPDPPTIETYAAVMLEVCGALGLDEVDVLGYHTGSKIAVAMAEAQPERVHRLVLISAPVYTADERAVNADYFLGPTDLHADGSHLMAKWQELWAWRGPDRTPWMIQREVAEQLRGGPISWWGHHAAFGYDHVDHLPRVADRVLVICPGDDLQEPTRRARALLPAGAFLDRPDWGHGVLDTRTAEIADVVRRHVDGVERSMGPGSNEGSR